MKGLWYPSNQGTWGLILLRFGCLLSWGYYPCLEPLIYCLTNLTAKKKLKSFLLCRCNFLCYTSGLLLLIFLLHTPRRAWPSPVCSLPSCSSKQQQYQPFTPSFPRLNQHRLPAFPPTSCANPELHSLISYQMPSDGLFPNN